MEIVTKLADMQDLITYWPALRKGLLVVKRNSGPYCTWTPEHVRAAVAKGNAELWLGLRDNVLAGFGVTQMGFDPFLQLPTSMFAWIAYHDPDDGASPTERQEASLALENYIIGVARERGCLYLEAATAIPAVAKLYLGRGWKSVLTVFRRDTYEE